MNRVLVVAACRVVLAGLLVLVAGCDRDHIGPWQEQVRLGDGRVIVVERDERFRVSDPIGDVGAAFIQNTTLRFIDPPALAELPTLSIGYRPILLDYDPEGGYWYVIAVNDHACWPTEAEWKAGHLNATGRANIHPNFEYRLIDGTWREVEIGADRIGRGANLLITRTTIDDFDVVPLSEKHRLDGHPRLPEPYRRVEPLIACR